MPDDRDRLVGVHACAHDGLRAGTRAGDHRAELPRDRGGRRVVVDERRGQPQAGELGQAVAQLDRPAGESIPSSLKRAPRPDRIRPIAPEHRGGLGSHDVQQRRLALAGRHRRQRAARRGLRGERDRARRAARRAGSGGAETRRPAARRGAAARRRRPARSRRRCRSACASPSETVKRARPPSSRRSDPMTATAASSAAASTVPSTANVSTGWGLDSTNAVTPSRTSARVACSKRTGSRRLRYQYSGPSSVCSTGSPLIDE